MEGLKPKYFLYARKSTEDDDKQVMSIEAQLFELREYARREDLEVLQEFQEAKSAKKPGREQFGEMMTRIERGEAQGVLSWHPDRLARNSVDGGRVIYLVDIGRIASLRFPQFWFEPTPQGKFMLQVAFGQSKYFSDNLVENVKRGFRQKIRRGEWLTKAPYGYVNNLKTRNIEPHPVYSKIIVRAFEEYTTGTHTIQSLANLLAELGLTTKSQTPLGKASVVRLLANRAYLGFIKHHGEWHEGSFAPILSPTLFEGAQKVLQSKRRPRRSKVPHGFPFLQMSQCAECGGMITAQYTTNRFGTKYTYYRCTKKLGTCRQPYVAAASIASQFKSALQSVSLPCEELDKMEAWIERWDKEDESAHGSVAQNLKDKIRTNQEKLDRLVSLYLDNDIERAQYLSRKDILLREKVGLLEEQSNFGQRRKHWIEPLRKFVLSLREAKKLAETNEYHEYRQFFRKIGSNPSLKDKTISIGWHAPWEFTASAFGGSKTGSAFFALQKTLRQSLGDDVSLGDPTGNRTPI